MKSLLTGGAGYGRTARRDLVEMWESKWRLQSRSYNQRAGA